MYVRIVGMAMDQDRVGVHVTVWLALRIARSMRMLMMQVVVVSVLVRRRLVGMLVDVLLRQVKI
jgi:hypothetical protein